MAAEVATDYADLRAFQQRIQIAKDNLKAQQNTAELTRQKFKAGLATNLDVANADALVATTEATIPPLETSERQTIYALSVLLARPPAALKEELSAPGPIPQAPAQVPVGLPSALLERRPDVRQSEELVHAATAQIGVAVSAVVPAVLADRRVRLRERPGPHRCSAPTTRSGPWGRRSPGRSSPPAASRRTSRCRRPCRNRRSWLTRKPC